MSALTPEQLAALQVFKGLESMEQDIELLSQFQQHAIGCGLESLDSPSGKLVEQGLVARFPGHIQTGSGLEGIGNLLTSLKDAVSKLKGVFKGKTPEQIIEKPTDAAKKALLGTYTSGFWGKYKTKEADTVKAPSLLTLVKGGTFAEVKAQLESTIGDGEKQAKDFADELVKYWTGVKPLFEKLKAEENAVVLLDICNEIIAYADDNKLPVAPSGFNAMSSGGTLAPLSESEANDAVTYLIDLLDRSQKIYGMTDQGYGVGITNDDADSYLDTVTDVKNAPIKNIYKAFGRPELTNGMSQFVEEVRGYIFSAITGLEAWVEASRE